MNAVLPDLTWAGRADRGCAGTDPWLWHPTKWDGAYLSDFVPPEAAELCARCPVRRQCKEHAIRHEPYGVWAGTSEDQRARARRNRGIRISTWQPPESIDPGLAQAQEETA